ncbi:MAG: murein biosynthesis integral membrane protein MurJ [Planctomycetota bacterium]
MTTSSDQLPPGGVDVVARHGRLVFRTVLISSLTLSSRLIGFAREALAAAMFGDRSSINDAFVTAWRVPNLFRSLLGEGAMSTALQTAITKADAERGEEAGRALFLAIARVLTLILVVLCASVMLLVFYMPDRMPITGWAWLGSDPGPVRELTIRMMPFVILVCLSALASGALNVRGHFLSPSLAPVLMNLFWIGGLVAVGIYWGWTRPAGTSDADEYGRQFGMVRWLASFALVTGVVLLLVQVPALVSNGFLGRRSVLAGVDALRVPTRQVLDVLKASAPLALGAAVYQVNVMVDGFMALGLLGKGGASVLYYATRVQQFPMSLVSIAATSAVFPALTALGHRRDLPNVRVLHDRTQLAIAFVAIPATVGLLFFTEPIVSVIFHHGQFTQGGVDRASDALRFLTLAILPAGAAGLVARTYYALGDFRTPVRISVLALFANVLLNLLFVRGFGMEVGGMTLATATTAWANLMVLSPGLRTRLGLPAAQSDFFPRLLRILAAALGSSFVAWVLYRALHAGERHSAVLLFAAIGVSVGVYAVLCHLLRIPEWSHVLDRARGRGRT